METTDATMRITNRADLDAALDRLAARDPLMARTIADLPGIPLRLRPAGFAGMAEIIVGQMVSKASATAINARLAHRLGDVTAQAILAAGAEGLDGVGLSRAKTRALLALAEAESDGRVDFEAVATMPTAEASGALTALPGIGPWSVEVYLMFCAGHGDLFPVGDVALRQGLADLGLASERPDQKKAQDLASRWAPLRSAAARVVWAAYAVRRRTGGLPV